MLKSPEIRWKLIFAALGSLASIAMALWELALGGDSISVPIIIGAVVVFIISVLAAWSGLRAAFHARNAAGGGSPKMLPPTKGQLHGRKAEFSEASSVLVGSRSRKRPRARRRQDSPTGTESQARTVVISGAPGVGKTHLALHLAHETAKHFPDGLLYVDLSVEGRAPLSANEALAQLLHQLGLERSIPGDWQARTSMLYNRLAGRRVLLLLDNAVRPDQVRPLVPASATCAVIITCRRLMTTLSASTSIRLDRVTPEVGLDILSDASSRKDIDTAGSYGREIVELCDRVPLALVVVGSRLAARGHLGVDRIANELRDERTRLQKLDHEGIAVSASLAIAYRSLPEDEQRMLRYLGIGAFREIGLWHAAAVTGLPEDEAEELLHRLNDAFLVEVAGNTGASLRFRIHDLVRAFATQRLAEEETAESRRQASARLAAEYAARARRAGADRAPEWNGSRSTKEGADWFRDERENLNPVVDLIREHELHGECWQLVSAMAFFHDELAAFPSEFEQVFRAGVRSAQHAESPVGEGTLRCGLGELFLREDRYEEAGSELEKAHELLSRIHDAEPLALARCERLQGLLSRESGDYATAHEKLSSALSVFEQRNDVWGYAQTCRSLGKVHRARAEGQKAIRVQAEAVDAFRSFGDAWQTARALDTIALSYIGHTRQLQEADEASAEALEVFREFGDEIWIAKCLYTRGHVLRLTGRPQESHKAYTEGLHIFQRYEVRIWTARMLNARARAAVLKGSTANALADVDTATAIFQNLGHAVWEANTARMRAWLDCYLGDPVRAIERVSAAGRVSAEHGDRWAAMEARYWEGVFHRAAGRLDRSREILEPVVAEYREARYSWFEAIAAADLVRTLRESGDQPQAEAMDEELSGRNAHYRRVRGRDGATVPPEHE